jgi:hypothetical protein
MICSELVHVRACVGFLFLVLINYRVCSGYLTRKCNFIEEKSTYFEDVFGLRNEVVYFFSYSLSFFV